MSDRPNCLHRDTCNAKTLGKHCSPCTTTAMRADPAFEAKRAAAFRAKLHGDPEFKAKHCAASAKRLSAWRSKPESMVGANERSRANLAFANTPEVIAKRNATIRRKLLGWCPKHRIEEYMALARKMSAARARRVIERDESDRAKRAIAAFNDNQRAREERRQRESY